MRDLPVKFTRQKPLGRYIADFYCASRMLASLEFEGIRLMRLSNLEVMEQFEGVCQRIQDALARLA